MNVITYRSTSQDRNSGKSFPVSTKQLKFINQLVAGIDGLNARKPDEYCQHTFGATCKQLSSKDVSRPIDDLKEAKDGGKEDLA